LQGDPVGLLAGPNTYTYSLNAPVKWVDQYGLSPTTDSLIDIARDCFRRIGGGKGTTVSVAIVCDRRTGGRRGVGGINSGSPLPAGSPPPGFTLATRRGSGRHAEGNIQDSLGPDEFIEAIGSSTKYL